MDRKASRIGVECGGTGGLASEEREGGLEAHVSELMAIGRRCADQLRDGPSAVEHGDFLYDEHGLPK